MTLPLDKQHSASLSGHFCVCGVGGVAARFWTGNWHRDVGTCVQHLFCVQGDTPRMQEGDIGQESRGLSPVTKGSAHRSRAWRPRITWLQVLGDTPSPHGTCTALCTAAAHVPESRPPRPHSTGDSNWGQDDSYLVQISHISSIHIPQATTSLSFPQS